MKAYWLEACVGEDLFLLVALPGEKLGVSSGLAQFQFPPYGLID
jgi:hypothetical protein